MKDPLELVESNPTLIVRLHDVRVSNTKLLEVTWAALPHTGAGARRYYLQMLVLVCGVTVMAICLGFGSSCLSSRACWQQGST